MCAFLLGNGWYCVEGITVINVVLYSDGILDLIIWKGSFFLIEKLVVLGFFPTWQQVRIKNQNIQQHTKLV